MMIAPVLDEPLLGHPKGKMGKDVSFDTTIEDSSFFYSQLKTLFSRDSNEEMRSNTFSLLGGKNKLMQQLGTHHTVSPLSFSGWPLRL